MAPGWGPPGTPGRPRLPHYWLLQHGAITQRQTPQWEWSLPVPTQPPEGQGVPGVPVVLKVSPQTSSISINWECVRNPDSQPTLDLATQNL